MMEQKISELQDGLAQLPKITLREDASENEENCRPAAVLLPLVFQNEEWQMLFVRRAENLRSHSGQVAFPGGKQDPQDVDSVATALRELEEEVGIDRKKVRILGTLPRFHTVSEWLVTPVVGIIPANLELRLDERETAAAFFVPLHWLADKRNLRSEIRQHPRKPKFGSVYYYQPYAGQVIWGATAHILQTFLPLWVQVFGG